MPIAPTSVLMFVVSVVFQIASLSLLPLSKGFTSAVPSIFCVIFFAVGLGLLARLVHLGTEVGVLIPISAASVPVATMIVGILFFGESASALKIGLLAVACLCIGLASAVAR